MFNQDFDPAEIEYLINLEPPDYDPETAIDGWKPGFELKRKPYVPSSPSEIPLVAIAQVIIRKVRDGASLEAATTEEAWPS